VQADASEVSKASTGGVRHYHHSFATPHAIRIQSLFECAKRGGGEAHCFEQDSDAVKMKHFQGLVWHFLLTAPSPFKLQAGS
jgi:hypothetical protein